MTVIYIPFSMAYSPFLYLFFRVLLSHQGCCKSILKFYFNSRLVLSNFEIHVRFCGGLSLRRNVLTLPRQVFSLGYSSFDPPAAICQIGNFLYNSKFFIWRQLLNRKSGLQTTVFRVPDTYASSAFKCRIGRNRFSCRELPNPVIIPIEEVPDRLNYYFHWSTLPVVRCSFW